MKRLPVLATLIVLAAVLTMIGLGVWQLQRRAEKQALLARLTAAQGGPVLDLTGGPISRDAAYRRVRLNLVCDGQAPQARAGRDRQARSGWVWRKACRTGAGETLQVVIGWSTTPNLVDAVPIAPIATGTLAGTGDRLFYLDRPPAPLKPAAPPTPEDIPNNHMLYALQWFFFAGAATVIYLLALRRRPH